MTRSILAVFALTAAAVQGAPTTTHDNHLAVRSNPQVCTPYNIIQTGDWILYNNLWGAGSGTGQECTALDWHDSDPQGSYHAISWQTFWTWNGGENSVKSYPNAELQAPLGAQLSQIQSMPSTWKWSYSGNNVRADVSYDAFFSHQADRNAPHTHEIMIWLAALNGVAPIGAPNPIATVTLAGHEWKLFHGSNTNGQDTWQVYSFLATDTVDDFQGDVNEFFRYLTAHQGVDPTLYLQYIGAGTEPFTGDQAVLTVSPYQLSINV